MSKPTLEETEQLAASIVRRLAPDEPHERILSRRVPFCEACHRDAWDCVGTDRCGDCDTLMVVDEGREVCPRRFEEDHQ